MKQQQDEQQSMPENDAIALQLKSDNLKLTRILDDWDNDSIIDKTSPNDSIAVIGNLHAKYLRVLATHNLNASKIIDEYNKMKTARMAYYDGSISLEDLQSHCWEPWLGPAPKIKTQMDSRLESDPYLLAIMSRKRIYEEVVKVCEAILKELNNRTWQLKSYMQWEMNIRNV